MMGFDKSTIQIYRPMVIAILIYTSTTIKDMRA